MFGATPVGYISTTGRDFVSAKIGKGGKLDEKDLFFVSISTVKIFKSL